MAALDTSFATAFPAAGANSTANFIPEIWSKKLQAKFYASSVLPAISNNDYEGEISDQGNKVIIRTVPTVTIKTYTGAVTYDDVTGEVIELMIDKAKFYAFRVHDVAKAQADIKFQNEATSDAGEQMRIAVETDFLANIQAGAGSEIARVSVTKDNILDTLVDVGTALDEANIPEEGRFVVLPPKYTNLIKKSDLKDASITGDGTSVLRNGRLGMIDRFTIYQSNLLATANAGVDHLCLAGIPKASCFASQFVKTETVRLTDTFGDGIRGLKVYGYKVVVPTALIRLKLRTTA
jgi:hypothetical protein